MIETATALLSEALDLCVRAKRIDDPEKLSTIHLWVEDQYDKDLEDWQTRSRAFLMNNGYEKEQREAE